MNRSSPGPFRIARHSLGRILRRPAGVLLSGVLLSGISVLLSQGRAAGPIVAALAGEGSLIGLALSALLLGGALSAALAVALGAVEAGARGAAESATAVLAEAAISTAVLLCVLTAAAILGIVAIESLFLALGPRTGRALGAFAFAFAAVPVLLIGLLVTLSGLLSIARLAIGEERGRLPHHGLLAMARALHDLCVAPRRALATLGACLFVSSPLLVAGAAAQVAGSIAGGAPRLVGLLLGGLAASVALCHAALGLTLGLPPPPPSGESPGTVGSLPEPRS
jgi:hypothetical protein